MYWASSPKDGDPYFKYQDGPWINTDNVLKEYHQGWQDVSLWPKSSRIGERINKSLKDTQLELDRITEDDERLNPVSGNAPFSGNNEPGNEDDIINNKGGGKDA
jgi:hypothetical protein